jgi:hypothetical protein
MTVYKENLNHFLGPIAWNPFEGVGPDTQIQIEQGVFVPNDPPGVYPIHNMAHYNGVFLSVHFCHKHVEYARGVGGDGRPRHRFCCGARD